MDKFVCRDCKVKLGSQEEVIKMKKGRMAIRNLLSSCMVQISTIIAGLILPHFFLIQYGSSINGMVSSVTQILSYLALVESGISASAIVQLYKPIAEHDNNEINRILRATRAFYKKSGFVYLALLLLLVCFYPFLIKNQVDTITTAIMIVVLACSNLTDYFVLGKYRVLLMACQEMYILNLIQIVGIFLNTGVSIFLMLYRVNVLVVKSIATIVYILRSIAVIIYVKRKYNIFSFSGKVDANQNILPQRWSALFHQIVGVICNNTDIILITVCMGNRSLLAASVYYVYSLVGNAFSSFFNSISNGLVSSFGELFAMGKDGLVRKFYNLFEYFNLIIITIIYICMFILIIPFVYLYTAGSSDVNYIRPTLAFLFVIMGAIQNLRIPSLTMICAVGHYKQTRIRALIEACINLSVSIVLIYQIGIEGAIIGTIVSYLYRSIDSIVYTSKKLIINTLKKTCIRVVRNIIIAFGLCSLLYNKINIYSMTWAMFGKKACEVFLETSIVVIFINIIFELDILREFLNFLKKKYVCKNRERKKGI